MVGLDNFATGHRRNLSEVQALLPAEQLPSIAFDWWDKAQHALAFFALGMLGFPAYPAQQRRVLLGLLGAGLAIEHQDGVAHLLTLAFRWALGEGRVGWAAGHDIQPGIIATLGVYYERPT